ncbi:MAG: hypothetical protein Q4C74_00455 [Rothia sp. (in: high G+C Gram-positive bacteria)]|nr:hypothetical protein [Rothia sp. (in: high G+C Gram-positive bacteria)]
MSTKQNGNLLLSQHIYLFFEEGLSLQVKASSRFIKYNKARISYQSYG